MNNFPELITFILKAGVLTFIALYLIFSVLVFLNVRGLGNFIVISYYRLSAVIQLLYIIHIFLVISLFLLALVIL